MKNTQLLFYGHVGMKNLLLLFAQQYVGWFVSRLGNMELQGSDVELWARVLQALS